MGIDFSLGVSILLLLLLYVAYFAYSRTVPTLSRGMRGLLMALRILSFLLIAFLLMDPRYILRSTRKEPAQTIALIDCSASMALPNRGWVEGAGPSRFDVALSLTGELRSAVEANDGKFSVVYFSGDLVTADADSVGPDGQGTDIGRAVRNLHKRFEGENVAAFVVVSDGVETEERLVRQALPPVPVFTVGVGDTSAPEDVRISDVDYNSIVRAPSRTTIEATLRYSGGSSRSVRLRLVESQRVVFEKDTLMTPQDRELVTEIPVDFPKAGRRNFVLHAEVDGHDVEAANNRRDIVIDAEKAGVRILIVDLLPTWEMHFLTEFLRKDESFDFDLVASVRDPQSIQDGRVKDPAEFTRLLDDYDALVLASVTNRFLDADVSNSIKKFVRGGKGLVILPGHSSLFEQSTAWSRLSEILPVSGTPPHRFNLQFTSVRPGAQAASNPITSQLVPLLSQTDWQQRSPLLGFYTPLAPKRGVQVLLETNSNRAPAFTYQSVGRGRVAVVSAGPLWRWKFLSDKSTLYDEMISRLLDVLSRGESTEKFVLFSKKNVYDSGETPVFTAEIFNEKMQPVTGVPVRIEVARIDEEGSEVPLDIVSMQREGSDNPRFKSTLPPLTPGKYRVKGEAELPNRAISSQTLDISVSDVSVEYQKVAQDRSNLLRIAGQTGGSYSDAEGAVAIANSIRLEPRTVDSTSEISLRTSMIVFMLILTFLAAEWIIRKRAGMI